MHIFVQPHKDGYPSEDPPPCLAHVGMLIVSQDALLQYIIRGDQALGLRFSACSCVNPWKLHFAHPSQAKCSFGGPAKLPQGSSIPELVENGKAAQT